jgi:hypothetical protein
VYILHHHEGRISKVDWLQIFENYFSTYGQNRIENMESLCMKKNHVHGKVMAFNMGKSSFG